jgi:glycosidase
MPFVYYGDEVGMTGGADPDCRRGMIWNPEKQDQSILQFYKKLIKVRKSNPVLTDGDPCEQFADDENGLVYIRRKDLLLVFHGRDGVVNLSQYRGSKDILTDEMFEGKIGPYQALVLKI